VKFTALNKKDHFKNLRKEEFCFADKGIKVFVQENTVGTNRLGISISSKHANAVNRNRFKRRIKEVVRGLETELNFDILVEGSAKAPQLKLIEIQNILTKHPLL
jgi:ribonuclease P protein component